ncbi:uncharacterized protein LOC126625433 [Malus sylvestris]|uniref:uncharacterized protein LOC126625433 n=1 Tax=Malus sylvestris TaxID=3752 RepID=UPI0021AC295F|nr:uncharacterized protein LOC126625433 [Malus sylvestris]
MNAKLLKPYSEEEVCVALFQMHPSKALGPDGHFLQNKRWGRKGSFALKLDLSKAYDRVEWNFLEAMMLSFLFGKAKLEECAEVQHILDMFCQASGQEINLGKSSIAFFANVTGCEQQGLAHFFGVQLVEQHERYLGLLTFVGRSKWQTFAYIKERVHKRLCGWKGKCLSGAGREFLVEVVAQALPSYAMNCFLIPKTFCDDLHQLMARFWWGSDPDSRKIHWKSWDKLCLAKPEGGMGLQNLYVFNLTVLEKQGWFIL